jgi:hypothetical protein
VDAEDQESSPIPAEEKLSAPVAPAGQEARGSFIYLNSAVSICDVMQNNFYWIFKIQ